MLMMLQAEKLTPRDYQAYGSHFLRTNRRAMLTDDAGLGKTLQASEAATTPALVVCPAYLIEQWVTFLRMQYPDKRTVQVWGDPTRRSRQLDKAQLADWTVVGYQTLRIYLEQVPEVRTVIFDESHHLRNRRSGQAQAADDYCNPTKASGRTAIENVFMLSATPMWKSVDDLWMQLHILQPRIFSSYNHFIDVFCMVADAGYDRKVTKLKKGMQRQLDELLSILKIGRTYVEVGRELPPIINKYIRLDLPENLFRTYKTVRDNYRLDYDEDFLILNAASVMHSLRQITAYPGKIDATVAAVRDASPTLQHPCIVFTWYRDTAETLHRAFGGGDHSVLINGDVDARRRQYYAKTAPIVVATMSSFREGVNMSHCRHVFFFEEDWPPGSNYQALRRVVRDRNLAGAVDPVIVTYIHVNKTLDTIIHKVSRQRTASMKDVMSEIFQ